MTPKQRKAKLDDLALRLNMVRQELGLLIPEFGFWVDQEAADSILIDLCWAAENCTVIGLHQIGKAMNDSMGHTDAGEVV